MIVFMMYRFIKTCRIKGNWPNVRNRQKYNMVRPLDFFSLPFWQLFVLCGFKNIKLWLVWKKWLKLNLFVQSEAWVSLETVQNGKTCHLFLKVKCLVTLLPCGRITNIVTGQTHAHCLVSTERQVVGCEEWRICVLSFIYRLSLKSLTAPWGQTARPEEEGCQ